MLQRAWRSSAKLLITGWFVAAWLACHDTDPFEPNYQPALPVFTNPTAITNPFLTLASLEQDVLDGGEGGVPHRVVRTRLPERRTFQFNGQIVETIVVLDSAFENGALVEVAHDYIAQSDAGDVYYFGEDVDIYANGAITAHTGSWLFGTHTTKLGILMPAMPIVGQKFRSEDVPGITSEDDEVISITESVTVPAGTFQDCVRIKEILGDGAIEFKLYARGVGVVQETSEDGSISLRSHR